MFDVSNPLFAEAPDGIVVVDRLGSIIAANTAALVMFDYDDLTGISVDDLVPAAARDHHAELRTDYEAQPRARRMGEGMSLEGLRAGGSAFPVDIALTPLGDDCIAAVIRDTTELERTWRRLDEQESAVAILEDRQRIARDLHDTVIQEVFAAGLRLNAVAGRLRSDDDGESEEQIRGVANALDHTIDRLRRTIFDIQQAQPGHIADEVRRIVDDMARDADLGTIELEVSPGVEVLTPRTVEHLLSTIREAVANVIKHAEAAHLVVTVVVEDGWCTLEVHDDGVGLSTAGDPGFGLENMRRRSEALGGSFIAAEDPSGTRLEWRVPTG